MVFIIENILMNNMFRFIFLISLSLHSVLLAPTADELLVTLPDGQIQGVEFVTDNNRSYYGFQGIPFASPPVGDLRFEAPQPPKPWSGIIDGSKERDNCVQMNFFPYGDSLDGTEDCLYINVYTPSLKPKEKLPVMFWIHGGGFIGGGVARFMTNPEYLIEEDVIVVTSNYRAGLFGFLSTGDKEIKGNFGLKDQVQALKWTQENIAIFGGDPEKVTIFGQSAGGQSTGLQLLSKQSKGLFRASIVESGSALTNSSATLNAREYAFHLASFLPGGNYGNDSQKLKEFLKQKTAEELNAAALNITGVDMHAWPTIEPEGEDAFLTESPYVLLDSGNFLQVPVLLGVCAEESAAFMTDVESVQKVALMLDLDSKKLIPTNLRPDPKDNEAVIQKIKSLYLKDNETFYTNLKATYGFVSDNKFSRALIKQAELQSKYVPVYLYEFSYANDAEKPVIEGLERAAHGAELNYLFKSSQPNAVADASDVLTRKRMVKMWTNFAKYLNPTPEKTEILDVIWPTVSQTNLNYLNINKTLEVLQDFKGHVNHGWNETYYSYGKQPFVTY